MPGMQSSTLTSQLWLLSSSVRLNCSEARIRSPQRLAAHEHCRYLTHTHQCYPSLDVLAELPTSWTAFCKGQHILHLLPRESTFFLFWCSHTWHILTSCALAGCSTEHQWAVNLPSETGLTWGVVASSSHPKPWCSGGRRSSFSFLLCWREVKIHTSHLPISQGTPESWAEDDADPSWQAGRELELDKF